MDLKPDIFRFLPTSDTNILNYWYKKDDLHSLSNITGKYYVEKYKKDDLHSLSNITGKYYVEKYENIFNDPSVTQWFEKYKSKDSLSDIIKKVAEDTKLAQQKALSVAWPIELSSGKITISRTEYFIILEKAAKRFNSHLPNSGAVVHWGRQTSSGQLWELQVINQVLCARLSPIGTSDALTTMMPIPIHINGVRRIKKSTGALTELIIERLFTLNASLEEETLFSII